MPLFEVAIACTIVIIIKWIFDGVGLTMSNYFVLGGSFVSGALIVAIILKSKFDKISDL